MVALHTPLERVQQILQIVFMVDPETVFPGEYLSELVDDSLGKMEFVMELEDEFHLEISDKDAGKLVLVDDVLRYLEQRGIT